MTWLALDRARRGWRGKVPLAEPIEAVPGILRFVAVGVGDELLLAIVGVGVSDIILLERRREAVGGRIEASNWVLTNRPLAAFLGLRAPPLRISPANVISFRKILD